MADLRPIGTEYTETRDGVIYTYRVQEHRRLVDVPALISVGGNDGLHTELVKLVGWDPVPAPHWPPALETKAPPARKGSTT